jgi:penicillin-binding protein 2
VPPLPAPRLRLAEPLARVEPGSLRGPGFFPRVAILSTLALAAFGVLLLRLWSLQVVHGRAYAHAAARQTIRVVLESGPRGPIVDVRGRPLAAVEGEDVIEADPRKLGPARAGGAWRPNTRGQALVRRLAHLSDQPAAVLVDRIRSGLARSPFANPVVLPHPERALALYLLERADEFPGLHVTTLSVRRYPQGVLASAFLGLIGEISARQLRERRFRGYEPGELVGQSGVEATYDRILRGGLHGTRLVVNALGRPLTARSLHAPAPHGLRLTIDARLQRTAERAVRDGIRLAHAGGHADAHAGAAVVLDPRTGAVEALASYPSFDQESAARNRGSLVHLLVASDAEAPLFDRTTQGLYPPGSTFKPVVAEAGLVAGLLGPASRLSCTSSLTVGDTVFHNVEAGIDARLTLPRALAVSCDTWFYRLGLRLYGGHPRVLRRWARSFGFGTPTDVDLPGESGGVTPEPRYAGDAVNLSIGQGELLVTPLQLAVAYAALANGGTIVQPHLAAAVLSARGRVLRRLLFPARARLRLRGLAAIREGLYLAAHDPGGTSAGIFAHFPVPIAGKTGTAQAPTGSDHSWYASWAPARRPTVVVVVLIEHGGFGADAAAPAAREIYDSYFGRRDR